MKKIVILIITLSIGLTIVAGCLPNTITLGETTFSGPLNISNGGSASAPAITFANDTDTGIYHSTENNIDFATSGIQRANISSSGLNMLNLPVLNIGAAGTDFTTTGGLVLADGITVTAGAIDFPSASINISDLGPGLHGLGANVHSVCSSGCDYTSIATAVSVGNASAGDTIIIAPGTYNETVTISQTLTIFAYGATITGNSDSATLDITYGANGTITLLGGTYIGPNSSVILNQAQRGIAISGGSNHLIKDVTIIGGVDDAGNEDGTLQALLLAGGSTGTIINATITGGDDQNISTPGGAGTGLLISDANTNWTIIDSSITGGNDSAAGGGTGLGLKASNSASLTLSGNTIVSAGSRVAGDGESGAVWGSTGTLTAKDGVQFLASAKGTNDSYSGIEITAAGTVNLYGVKVTGPTGASAMGAIEIAVNTATTNITYSTLVAPGTNSPPATILCATGTTVSLALSATNIAALESIDCTNDIGIPNNVQDADID